MHGRYQSELMHALRSPRGHTQHESAGSDHDEARLDGGKWDKAMLHAAFQPQPRALDVGPPPHAHGAQVSSEDTDAAPIHTISNHAGSSSSLSDWQGRNARGPPPLTAEARELAGRAEAPSLAMPYPTVLLLPLLASVAPPHEAAHAVSQRASALEPPPRPPQYVPALAPAPPQRPYLAPNTPFPNHAPDFVAVPPVHRMSFPAASTQPPPTHAEAGRHVLSDEAPPVMYSCQHCPKRFLSEQGFRMHQRSHDGPKPYKCPITTCGRTFTTRPNAVRHLTSHGDAAVGLHILRLTTRVVTTARIAHAPTAGLRQLTQGRVLPPPGPSAQNAARPASLDAACASVTRAGCYPLRLPDPALLVAPCPLPPVRRRPGVEERDSWDPPPTDDPYHPVGWLRRPVLPGPAIETELASELNLEAGAAA